jgi:hypothetical protein
MAKQDSNPVVVHMDVRKLNPAPETNHRPMRKTSLKKKIEEAVMDAYNEEGQTVGFLTMIQDHLAIPFFTTVFSSSRRLELNRSRKVSFPARRSG